MCGLAGWITQDGAKLSEKNRYKRARALEGLLVANATRGTDASGLAVITGKGPLIRKMAKDAMVLIEDEEFRGLARRADARIAISHTRLATCGANVDANAHPFSEGHVVGAHNGVITNYMSLDGKLRDLLPKDVNDSYDYAEVDSQVVFRTLSASQPQDYLDALAKVNGSCALTWYDDRNSQALWMVQHENPLHAAWVPLLQTMFWSSQYDHLSAVMWAAFGTGWHSVPLKKDTLHLFQTPDVLGLESWPVVFPVTSYGSGKNDYWKYAGWDDEDPKEGKRRDDEDAKVIHPFAVAKVHRVAGASKDSTSSDNRPTVTPTIGDQVRLVNELGLPMAIPSGVAEMEDDDEDGLLEYVSADCAVCRGSIEDGMYYPDSKSWVCNDCEEIWSGQGMDSQQMSALLKV